MLQVLLPGCVLLGVWQVVRMSWTGRGKFDSDCVRLVGGSAQKEATGYGKEVRGCTFRLEGRGLLAACGERGSKSCFHTATTKKLHPSASWFFPTALLLPHDPSTLTNPIIHISML